MAKTLLHEKAGIRTHTLVPATNKQQHLKKYANHSQSIISKHALLEALTEQKISSY